jgi:hypothetical protein
VAGIRRKRETRATPVISYERFNVIRIMNRNAGLCLDPVFVTKPEKFKGVFAKGDKVLEVAFHAENPKSAYLVLNEFRKKFGQLKERGYAGFYGDTSNTVLLTQAKKIGAEVIEAPLLERGASKTAYAIDTLISDYPKKYLLKPVKRIVFRF